jgi:hypothetical protein
LNKAVKPLGGSGAAALVAATAASRTASTIVDRNRHDRGIFCMEAILWAGAADAGFGRPVGRRDFVGGSC